MSLAFYRKIKAIFGPSNYILEMDEEKIITEIAGKRTESLFTEIKDIIIVGDNKPSIRINFKDGSHTTMPGRYLDINKSELERELLLITGKYPGLLVYENEKILTAVTTECMDKN
jgi:hypothetical protein